MLLCIMFIDEVYLVKGNMFEIVINWVRESGMFVIGLIGIFKCLDGKLLGDLFDDMIEVKFIVWLI